MPRAITTIAGALLGSALVLAAGCGRSPTTGPASATQAAQNTQATRTPQSTGAASVHKLSDAERRFGASPKRGEGVTYQPDVIVMEDGAEAIRSQDANGLTWTIDGNAPGASEIAVDKILFATGRAVGRVLKVDHSGSDLAVTLGPVALTDLLKEAHISHQGTLDPADMIVYVGSPDYPGAMSEIDAPAKVAGDGFRLPAAGRARVRAYVVSRDGGLVPLDPSEEPLQRHACAPDAHGRVRASRAAGAGTHESRAGLRGVCGASGGRLRYVSSGTGTPALGTAADLAAILLGGFNFFPTFNEGGVGVEARYNEDGVRFLAQLRLKLARPKFTFHLDISDGLKTASVQLDGFGGVVVGIEGSTNGGYKNIKKEFAIPVDISFTIPGPLPFAATFHQSLWVKTLLTGEHSIIRANGDYQLQGTIVAGIINGSPSATAPLFIHTVQDMAHTLSGESLAVNGLVLSYGGKLIVGVGSFGLVVGPYLSLNTAVGLDKGSILQRGTVGYVCRSAQLSIFLDYGVGFAVPSWSQKALDFALSFFHAKRIDLSYTKKIGTIPIKAETDAIPPGCAKPAA